MRLVIFETIEVFVSFTAVVASVGFMFLHAESAGVRVQSLRVDDRKRAIVVSS